MLFVAFGRFFTNKIFSFTTVCTMEYNAVSENKGDKKS